jgi:hypothetical protein
MAGFLWKKFQVEVLYISTFISTKLFSIPYSIVLNGHFHNFTRVVYLGRSPTGRCLKLQDVFLIVTCNRRSNLTRIPL